MHPGSHYKGKRYNGGGRQESNQGNGGDTSSHNNDVYQRGRGGRGGGGGGRGGGRGGGWEPRGRGRGRGGIQTPSAQLYTDPNKPLPAAVNASDSNKNDVKTWSRKDFHAMVQSFVENDSAAELTFPPTLDAAQRNLVHRIAMQFNLDHKSSGVGNERCLKLTKIGGMIDILKRQEDAAEKGERIKTIDGYQGAQRLGYAHLTDESVKEATSLLALHQESMKKEIRILAMRGSGEEKHFRARQAGMQQAPPNPKHTDKSALEAFRHSLPAYKRGKEIIAAVKENDVVVICGDTGCGKTTQIPQMLHDSGIFPRDSDVVCTQPRRISALSVANRVATERGEGCGNSCGYIIRFENVTSPKTHIIYQTTGILLRRLHGEPELRGVACVIVDEVHERDVETDFCLLLLRDRLMDQRIHPEKYPIKLKLVVMSATVQIESLVKYFDGTNGSRQVPLISIPGTLFPVQEYFLEDAMKWVGAAPSSVPAMALVANRKPENAPAKAKNEATAGAKDENAALYEELKANVFDAVDRDVEALVSYDLVCSLIEHIHHKERDLSGSILVFLPGWSAITRIAEKIRRSPVSRELSVLMLHSSLTSAEQQRVFDRPPKRYRKVVLATSIAETSITIDDVVYVIDSGLVKGTSYDPKGNTTALRAGLIGKANGVQRRGRAGRCRAGVCVHLLPKSVYDAQPEFLPPEIVRSPLEEVCLQLKAIESHQKCSAVLARAMDPPPASSVEHAVQFLTDMGAFTEEEEELTNLGRALAQLPTHPLLGKMLFTAACFGVLDSVATIAAGLSVKSPFVRPQSFQKNAARENLLRMDKGLLSDHFCVVSLFQGWLASGRSSNYAYDNFADNNTLRSLDRTKKQFMNLVLRSSFCKGIDNVERHVSRYNNNLGLARLAVLWSLYPRLATIEYRANRNDNRPQVFCWDNKSATFSVNSVLAFNKKANFNGETFTMYYDRMNLESVLNIFDASVVSTIDVALCLRQLTVRPLLDVPAMLLRDEESKLAPPVYLNMETLENKDSMAAMFYDGDKKLYIAPKKIVAVVQATRACMDYFLASSIKNVRASRFPDDVVRAIAVVIGYPITGTVDVSSAAAALPDPSFTSGVKEHLDNGTVPDFARRDVLGDDGDSSGSDGEGGPCFVDDEGSDEASIEDVSAVFAKLTDAQKKNVSKALGDLAIFRCDGALQLLDAAKAFEDKQETSAEEAKGDEAGPGEKVHPVEVEAPAPVPEVAEEAPAEVVQDESDDDDDEDVMVGTCDLNKARFA